MTDDEDDDEPEVEPPVVAVAETFDDDGEATWRADEEWVIHTATTDPSAIVVAMSTATRRHVGTRTACFGTSKR